MTLVICVVIVALLFEYVNGFHDTANAIATSVATKVLTPGQAILLSACGNLVGALVGDAVAKTIGQGLVDTNYITSLTIMCALIGAIIWNLFTWWIGLPSSSSHALIGGLAGATLATASGNWQAIKWITQKTKVITELVPAPHDVLVTAKELALAGGTTNTMEVAGHTVQVVMPVTSDQVMLLATRTLVEHGGIWHKVVKPMFLAPFCGLLVGFVVMGILLVLLRRVRPRLVNSTFGKMQLFSAAWMSYEHGRNDAQKTMGIIALTLFAATTQSHAFANLPDWLGFLRTPKFEIAFWIKVVCAITIAAGTAAGGWKIIKTMGKNVVRMQPIHGFAAQTTAAAVIGFATHLGIPLSTTHVISGSIMGVGSTKRLNAVKWSVAERMLWAWVLTLPITGGIAFVTMWLFKKLGMA
ncbi:MAG: inorganic phosphate transporter [Verrucomicrobia bacterium]|nr:inorganic phosphate transporter [Verrucomicrobiota bacterium]